MRHFIILFIVIFSFCGSNESFAGRKVQWQKYMNDTAYHLYCTHFLLQDACIDDSNNIYFTYVHSSTTDTTLTFLRKVSAEGQIVFDKLMISYSLNNKIRTSNERKSKLYFDVDGNLVFITAGTDSLANLILDERFIHLSKWTKDGNLIAEKWDYLNEKWNSSALTDFNIKSNGDIYVVHEGSPNWGPLDLTIRKYNKNFDSLYSLKRSIYCNHPAGAPVLATKDTLLYIAYSETDGKSVNRILIKKINMNTGLEVWSNDINNPFTYSV